MFVPGPFVSTQQGVIPQVPLTHRGRNWNTATEHGRGPVSRRHLGIELQSSGKRGSQLQNSDSNGILRKLLPSKLLPGLRVLDSLRSHWGLCKSKWFER